MYGRSPRDTPSRSGSWHCGNSLGFLRAGHSAEQDRQPTREGHKADSYLLSTPLVPWAMCERQYLALGRSPTALGSDHGLVLLGISLAMAAKGRITRLAYLHT